MRTGPVLRNDEERDRGHFLAHALDACRMVSRTATAAGIPHYISPHSLWPAAITNALDAGVPLRDSQILARHAAPTP